ncbi:hypothetical protein SAMN05444144_106213 [Flavobacterium akiainvivens]|nr:hypothetical protein SAMN05444144_106213 [Flavobacterium akiainvivens]
MHCGFVFKEQYSVKRSNRFPIASQKLKRKFPSLTHSENNNPYESAKPKSSFINSLILL